MDTPHNIAEHISNHFLGKIGCVLNNADLSTFHCFIQVLDNAERVFLVGAGRSGLVCRFFAMRLMHLGKQVFMVGDVTTPSIQQGDILIAISGSGNTQSVVVMAEKARQAGAKIVSIGTIKPCPSQLDKFTDLKIKLDRRSESINRGECRQQEGKELRQNITPLGTVFEISSLVYLESVIGHCIRRDETPETDMSCRHANLE